MVGQPNMSHTNAQADPALPCPLTRPHSYALARELDARWHSHHTSNLASSPTCNRTMRPTLPNPAPRSVRFSNTMDDDMRTDRSVEPDTLPAGVHAPPVYGHSHCEIEAPTAPSRGFEFPSSPSNRDVRRPKESHAIMISVFRSRPYVTVGSE